MKIITFEKSVGGILFRMEGEKTLYLLLHYPSGHWDFPKGHVEDGETENQTLAREVWEETGITEIEIIPRFKKWVGYFYRAKGNERKKREKNSVSTNVAKRVAYYLIKTTQQKVVISFEHVGYSWLDYEQAMRRITHPQSKKILFAAEKRLTQDR